jgi:membrane-bound lytic murein transglycosylase A
LELVWLEDHVEVFFIHIQGSAKIKLPDGSSMRIGFAGKNGHSYTSIGKHIVAKRLMKKSEISLENVKAWLRADKSRGMEVMWANRSFIFFREMGQLDEHDGPIGAHGVPLAAGRSLAVDRRYHQLGLPIWVSSRHLVTESGRSFARLMVAQDVGSAIKGAERGDIYWGSGDKAGQIAGDTHHAGQFVVLLPKRQQMRTRPRRSSSPAPAPGKRKNKDCAYCRAAGI